MILKRLTKEQVYDAASGNQFDIELPAMKDCYFDCWGGVYMLNWKDSTFDWQYVLYLGFECESVCYYFNRRFYDRENILIREDMKYAGGKLSHDYLVAHDFITEVA